MEIYEGRVRKWGVFRSVGLRKCSSEVFVLSKLCRSNGIDGSGIDIRCWPPLLYTSSTMLSFLNYLFLLCNLCISGFNYWNSFFNFDFHILVLRNYKVHVLTILNLDLWKYCNVGKFVRIFLTCVEVHMKKAIDPKLVMFIFL